MLVLCGRWSHWANETCERCQPSRPNPRRRTASNRPNPRRRTASNRPNPRRRTASNRPNPRPCYSTPPRKKQARTKKNKAPSAFGNAPAARRASPSPGGDLIGRRGARAQLDDADGVSPDARHHQRDFDSNHAFVKMASSNVLRSTSCSTMVVLLPVSTSS